MTGTTPSSPAQSSSETVTPNSSSKSNALPLGLGLALSLGFGIPIVLGLIYFAYKRGIKKRYSTAAPKATENNHSDIGGAQVDYKQAGAMEQSELDSTTRYELPTKREDVRPVEMDASGRR